MVADSYFSKKPVVDSMLSTGLHFISRLRGDSVLMYKYHGQKTGKKRRSKKFNGKVDFKNIGTNYFSLDFCTGEIKIYSAVVYSKAFKSDIKLAITIFFNHEKEVARKLYFSTDL